MTDPLPISKFAADAVDISYQCNRSFTFAILKDGQKMLEETYTPDNDGYVHIRGIAGLLSQRLYGTLGVADQTATAKGVFDFQVNGSNVYSKTVYSMRLQNPRDPQGNRKVMAAAEVKAGYVGRPQYITVCGQTSVYLYDRSGNPVASKSIGVDIDVETVDLDPRKHFPDSYVNGDYMTLVNNVSQEMKIFILPPPCEDAVTVRFLNRYDMPESLTAAYMQAKPQVQDDVAMMYGRRTRFDVKSSTEYTLKGFPLVAPEEYDAWIDLLTARRAQLLWQGQWVDIIITKANFTRDYRRFYTTQPEVSFQTASERTLV